MPPRAHARFLCVFLHRNVGDRCRYLPGALEAAVAGERDAFLPRVHEQCGAAVSGHAADGAGAIAGPARAYAPASHLSHGKCSQLPCIQAKPN